MRAPVTGGSPSDGRTALDEAMIMGSVLCCLVAAWLLGVVVFVLPARAPASLVPWALVAVSLVLLAGAGVWRSLPAGRSTVGAVLAAAVGAIAVAGGAWLMVPVVTGSREFEGYVIVVGAIAVAQGILVLTSALVRPRPQ